MNCHELETSLDTLLDGDLPREELARRRRGVRNHLEGCEACRSKVEPLLEWIAALGNGPDVPLPSRLARLPVRATATRERRGQLPWLRTAAAIVLLAGGAFLLRGSERQDQNHPAPAVTGSRPSTALQRGIEHLTPISYQRRETTVHHLESGTLVSTYCTVSDSSTSASFRPDERTTHE